MRGEGRCRGTKPGAGPGEDAEGGVTGRQVMVGGMAVAGNHRSFWHGLGEDVEDDFARDDDRAQCVGREGVQLVS